MAQQPSPYLEPIPDWTPEERPMLPGSPSTPRHSRGKRLVYFFIGVFIALTAGLSNGFILANLPALQGEYGLTPVEGAWLAAIYVMSNVTSNLVLFKTRQQFGIRPFAEIGLAVFVVVMTLHVFVQSYPMALAVRAVSGFTAAPLSSLGMYYVMQAFSKANMPKGLYMGLGFQQLGVPLAWVISPFLTSIGDWTVLYTFELGLALCCLAMVVTIKLPPGIRIQVFEKLDFVTFMLMAPAVALICAVLAQGTLQWWKDTPWLAYALLAGFVLLILAVFFEHHRASPLIYTRWLTSGFALRFALGALAIRFLLSEQNYAAISLLRTLGMGPDQLVPYYTVIFIGTITGTVLSAMTFKPDTILLQLFAAEILIIVACAIDYHISSDVRPQNMYVSQFFTAMATGIFMGPILMVGFREVLKYGANYMVTFILLFSLTQSFGGLLGSAFFGTYQQYREHDYSAQIIEHVNPTNPEVATRLQLQQQAYTSTVTDPLLRQAEGMLAFSRIASREAQVRAFSDVIVLNGIIAVIFFFWGIFNIWRARRAARREAMAANNIPAISTATQA